MNGPTTTILSPDGDFYPIVAKIKSCGHRHHQGQWLHHMFHSTVGPEGVLQMFFTKEAVLQLFRDRLSVNGSLAPKVYFTPLRRHFASEKRTTPVDPPLLFYRALFGDLFPLFWAKMMSGVTIGLRLELGVRGQCTLMSTATKSHPFIAFHFRKTFRC